MALCSTRQLHVEAPELAANAQLHPAAELPRLARNPGARAQRPGQRLVEFEMRIGRDRGEAVERIGAAQPQPQPAHFGIIFLGPHQLGIAGHIDAGAPPLMIELDMGQQSHIEALAIGPPGKTAAQPQRPVEVKKRWFLFAWRIERHRACRILPGQQALIIGRRAVAASVVRGAAGRRSKAQHAHCACRPHPIAHPHGQALLSNPSASDRHPDPARDAGARARPTFHLYG